jgi:Uma2 family endonuclease
MAVNTIQVQPRLITVEEYAQMVRAGVFPEDEGIELIEGQIISMSPIGASHAGHVIRLSRLFAAKAASRVLLSVQNPIRLHNSQAQPDLALLRARADDYTSGHPTAQDVLLVIEVSDSSAE